jgi:hypothetical protein
VKEKEKSVHQATPSATIPKKRSLVVDNFSSLSPSSLQNLSDDDSSGGYDSASPSITHASQSLLSPSFVQQQSMRDDDEWPVYGLVGKEVTQRRGRKKEMIPITHLLDIKCPPPPPPVSLPPQSSASKKKAAAPAHNPHFREQFLQAKYSLPLHLSLLYSCYYLVFLRLFW